MKQIYRMVGYYTSERLYTTTAATAARTSSWLMEKERKKTEEGERDGVGRGLRPSQKQKMDV